MKEAKQLSNLTKTEWVTLVLAKFPKAKFLSSLTTCYAYPTTEYENQKHTDCLGGFCSENSGYGWVADIQ